jgi:amidase
MARCVADCAVLLNIISGQDERDEYTLKQPSTTTSIDYTRALDKNALRGARIGIPRAFLKRKEDVEAEIKAFDEAMEIIKTLGAEIVDPADFSNWELLPEAGTEMEMRALTIEFKVSFEFLQEFLLIEEQPSA